MSEEKNHVSEIFEEIRNEHLNGKMDYESIDEKHTINDWVALIVNYASRTVFDTRVLYMRSYLIKAAGLIVSAIERIDTAGLPRRHYDQ